MQHFTPAGASRRRRVTLPCSRGSCLGAAAAGRRLGSLPPWEEPGRQQQRRQLYLKPTKPQLLAERRKRPGFAGGSEALRPSPLWRRVQPVPPAWVGCCGGGCLSPPPVSLSTSPLRWWMPQTPPEPERTRWFLKS